MHQEVPLEEKPGKGFRLGSAAAPTNPFTSLASHMVTGINLLLLTLTPLW